jgi:hypothetical protein
MGKAGSSGGRLLRSSVDLNVILCGYLHNKARDGAGGETSYKMAFIAHMYLVLCNISRDWA